MSSNPYWQLMLRSTLVTLPEWGIAYYHPRMPLEKVYGREYYEEYKNRSLTKIGEALNSARVELVEKYRVGPHTLIDVGVGAGNFVSAYACWGYDINPHAVSMLRAKNRYVEPQSVVGDLSLTFWDSLEHIPDPKPILDKITHYAFVSTPIYPDLHTLKNSKHYKPIEHCWYFTHEGIIQFMRAHGLIYIEHNQMETDIGRESIGTYVFGRPSVTTNPS